MNRVKMTFTYTKINLVVTIYTTLCGLDRDHLHHPYELGQDSVYVPISWAKRVSSASCG